MAIKTVYRIKHVCRHTADVDLSELAPGKRESRARWLATVKCTDCFRKESWDSEKETRRLEETQRANEFALNYGLEPLAGSEKQLMWSPGARLRLLVLAQERFDAEGLDDSAFRERIIEPANKIRRSGWWMDYAYAEGLEGSDVEELLETAEPDREDDGENLFDWKAPASAAE